MVVIQVAILSAAPIHDRNTAALIPFAASCAVLPALTEVAHATRELEHPDRIPSGPSPENDRTPGHEVWGLFVEPWGIEPQTPSMPWASLSKSRFSYTL